jgi:predicted TIM-barrel fold metal-dependent hydrolase
MNGYPYAGPIVDTHVHYWDPTRHYYPRLTDKSYTTFRYRGFDALKRPYLPDEYLVGARRHNIDKVVHMEATFDPNNQIGQTQFITELSAQFGVPNIIVPRVELERADAAEEMKKHLEWPMVRGIRQNRAGAATWQEAAAGRPSPLLEPDWLRGYEKLEQFGLHYELQIAWWHFDDAARLANKFPRTPIALNHAGLPEDRSADGLARWKDALVQLAECPNVHIKISGIGQNDHPWTVESNRLVVEQAIQAFGCSRAMFGSNFPVDSLCASFDDIWNGFREISSRYDAADQRRMLSENPHRFYRIDGV